MKNLKNIKLLGVGMTIIIIIVIIICCGIFYWWFNDLTHTDMDEIPNGVLEESVSSPKGDYTLNVYLVSLNALSQYGYKGELLNNYTNKTLPIYLEYPITHSTVDAEWIDDYTVSINDIILDVRCDIFDSRMQKE